MLLVRLRRLITIDICISLEAKQALHTSKIVLHNPMMASASLQILVESTECFLELVSISLVVILSDVLHV
jgi:hypothetical protein